MKIKYDGSGGPGPLTTVNHDENGVELGPEGTYAVEHEQGGSKKTHGLLQSGLAALMSKVSLLVGKRP